MRSILWHWGRCRNQSNDHICEHHREWGSRHHSAQGNVRASGLRSWTWAWFAWAGGRPFASVVRVPLVHKWFILWARMSQVQFPLDISQFTVQESTSFGWSFSMAEACSACVAWWTHPTAFPFCTWNGNVVFVRATKNLGHSFSRRFYLSVKSSLNRPVVPARVIGGEHADAHPESQHGHLCFISIGNKAPAMSDWIDLLFEEVVKFN